MIKDLDRRRAYWDVNHSTYQQGDSVPYPYEDYIMLFNGKSVLEIGPGDGRQYRHITQSTHVKLPYHVADISPDVLTEPAFLTCRQHLLFNYQEFLGQFDLIHFWYVLHHIRTDELFGFVNFLDTNLAPGGLIMFNSAVLEYDAGNYGDNGVDTTPLAFDLIERVFSAKFKILTYDRSKYGHSNGGLYIAVKKYGTVDQI